MIPAMEKEKLRWTQDRRMIVFERITKEFGPYSKWGHSRHPAGKLPEYKKVLSELSAQFSKDGNPNLWKAVRQQIEWGCMRARRIKHTQVYLHILNGAAAFYTGFIENKDMPDEVSISRRPSVDA